jgi:branched-chain amino acid transport system permease protein
MAMGFKGKIRRHENHFWNVMINFIQVLINGLLIGGIYSLTGISLALIVGVMDIVNFAHGEFVMLGMYAGFWAISLFHLPFYSSILLGIPLFYIFGLILYQTLVKRIVHQEHSTMVFATLGLSMFIQNVVLFLWTANYRSVRLKGNLSEVLSFWGLRIANVKLVSFIIILFATLLFYLFLNKTFIGKAIRAVRENPTGADLVGIDRGRIFRLSFGIGTALAALAGILLAPMYPIYPTAGNNFVLLAYVIVILGGLGSINGALVGGIIIGLVESLSGYFLAPNLKQLIYFALFIIILIIRPWGLFGQRQI